MTADVRVQLAARLDEIAALFGILDLNRPADKQLSRRELEVAVLAAAGLSNDEVAAHLFLSPNTVKTHLKGVFSKLGVRKRIHLPDALRNPDGVL